MPSLQNGARRSGLVVIQREGTIGVRGMDWLPIEGSRCWQNGTHNTGGVPPASETAYRRSIATPCPPRRPDHGLLAAILAIH